MHEVSDEGNRPNLCRGSFEIPVRLSIHAFVLVDSPLYKGASSARRRHLRRVLACSPNACSYRDSHRLAGGLLRSDRVGDGSQGGGIVCALIPVSVLVAILLAEPRTVLIDHDGIRQHRWLRGDRVISWNEIAWMKRGRNTGTTYVKSRNGGRPVSFSPLLVGQSRFEREVRKHASGMELDER